MCEFEPGQKAKSIASSAKKNPTVFSKVFILHGSVHH
jgi:hypothetical protein